MIDKQKLKDYLSVQINKFKHNNGYSESELHIQTYYIVDLLKFLGWTEENMKITRTNELTGKVPDILLMNDFKSNIFIIDSKRADKANFLDQYRYKIFDYCRTSGVYWGILTNFVEWQLYNEHLQRIYHDKRYAFHDLLWPNNDKSRYIDLMSDDGLSFLLMLDYTNMIEKGGKIDGQSEFYPEQDQIKTDFFEKIKKWRSDIYNYLKNAYINDMKEEILDLYTQKILDRLIFIEICTDKQVVAENSLNAIISSECQYYEEIKKKFKRFDEIFDTNLFLRSWIDEINIDNRTIKPIIEDICRIDFNGLSVHIIGEVYEEYIGKELQKREGAYYTPEYIVKYINTNTLGKILKKAKNEDDIRKIKVLDPACGSGSFLIGAFDEFKNAYERLDQSNGKPPKLFDRDRLVSILRDNLFGVDIDKRAVEITQLNLLIKALEDARHNLITGTKILPDLSLNIRSGDSLISGEQMYAEAKDYIWLHEEQLNSDRKALLELRKRFSNSTIDSEKLRLLSEIECYETKLNLGINSYISDQFKNVFQPQIFNYTVAFPEVFDEKREHPSFDVIIGNPPYRKERESKDLMAVYRVFEGTSKYCQGKMDYWYLFLHRALDISSPRTIISFITPSYWFNGSGASKLINRLKENVTFDNLIDFYKIKVFANSSTYSSIFIMNNICSNSNVNILKYTDTISNSEVISSDLSGSTNFHSVRYSKKNKLLYNRDNTIDINEKEIDELLKSIESRCTIVSGVDQLFEVKQGVIEAPATTEDGEGVFVLSQKELSNLNLNENERLFVKKYLRPQDVGQYYVDYSNTYILYIDNKDNKNIIDNKDHYPNIIRHLNKYQDIITSSNKPYGIHRARKLNLFTKQKIIGVNMFGSPSFAFSNEECIVNFSFNIINKSNKIMNLKVLLALLNSSFGYYWFDKRGKKRGANVDIGVHKLCDFPIPIISKKDEPRVKQVKLLVKYVHRLLILNANANKRKVYDAEIRAIKSIIDDIVYSLYDIKENDKIQINNYINKGNKG